MNCNQCHCCVRVTDRKGALDYLTTVPIVE